MEYKRYVQRNKHCLDFPNCDDGELFAIIFDVSSLEEEELTIELEGNKLKVSFKHGFRSTGNLNFSRDCTYVYALPEHIQSSNLVAHWSRDNFLVIKEEKSVAIARVAKSEEDLNEQGSEFVESPNYSTPTANDNEKTKQETTSNESRKNEENETKEIKLESLESGQEENLKRENKSETIAESEEKLAQEKDSKCASSEIGETAMQEDKSINVSNENREILMLENKATNVSNEGSENVILESKSINASNESEATQEEKSSSASSGSQKIIKQERKSPNDSKVSIEKLMQKDESMDATNTLLTKSRLIPKRVPHLLDLMISVGDLQAVMNDIEKKIKFVGEHIDKYSSES